MLVTRVSAQALRNRASGALSGTFLSIKSPIGSALSRAPRQKQGTLADKQRSLPAASMGAPAALPVAVYLVKLAGWAQGVGFLLLSSRRGPKLRSTDVTASSTGSPGLLLAYRLAMLAWALFIGVRQLAEKGPYVFVFFTVWNWWLLTLFFLVASAASMRAWARSRQLAGVESSSSSSFCGDVGGGSVPGGQQLGLGQGQMQGAPADWLEGSALALFAAEMPASLALDALTWLVLVPMLEATEQDAARRAYWHNIHHNFESYNMTLAIDFLTWAVLVPMLLEDPNAQRVQFWETRIFCFESYNQHGFNAVMMLGDLLLNCMPVTIYDSCWVALWGSLFGVWSGVFYFHTGRFIYPFLDAHKPYAWASYVGIFAVLWMAYLLFLGLVRSKAWVPALLRHASSAAALAGEPAPPGTLAKAGSGLQSMLVEAHAPLLHSDKLKVG